MSIIYSYPIKGTPANDDLILISDSASSPQFATKQIKVSSLPGGSSSGVSSFNALTGAVTITGGTNVTLNPVGNNIEINAASTSTQPGNPSASVQYNDGAGAFAGSANLTFATNTLTLTDTLDIKGDGTNPGTLKLYCENTTTPHAVSILGPVHTGATPYSIRLPKEIATQSVYSSGGRILESDASGALQWIVTPTGGGAVNQVTAGGVIPSSSGAPLIVTPSTGNVVVTSARYAGGSNEGHVPLGGSNTTFLRGDGTWVTPSSGGGISFNGTTANGIATYSSATQANVSSVFTVSGNKLSAPAGSEADPSVEVGAVGGLYAASGGIFLAHSGASAIGVNSSSIVNYKLTQFNAGLKFGVSGSTLSTYTEATWTSGPTLTFSFGGAATLSASAGSYRVIGDMVFAQFQFTFSSGGYGTADLSLPVSGVAGTGSINFAKMNSSLGNSTVSTPVTGDILTNAASIRLQSFNYDQDSGSHVSGQLFELAATSGQPVFQSGDVVSGTIIYRKA
jgi:hypothetical protein